MAPILRCASMRRPPAKIREKTSMETQTTVLQQGSSSKQPTSAKPQERKPSKGFDPAPYPFLWTPERSVELLRSMIGLKPAGFHKHHNVNLIKELVSKRLNMNVPINEIWKFLHAHWDLHLADQIENLVLKRERVPKRKCFEEEGAKLAQEAAQTQVSQPSTSRVPSDITKRKKTFYYNN